MNLMSPTLSLIQNNVGIKTHTHIHMSYKALGLCAVPLLRLHDEVVGPRTLGCRLNLLRRDVQPQGDVLREGLGE